MAEFGKYLFLVDKKANGPEVRKAIKAIYKVDVIATHVINTPSKKRRLGATIGVRSGYKKIIVTLKKGQKIEVMPS